MSRENDLMRLTISPDDDDVGYVTLPGHPGPGVPGAVKRSIRLRTLLDYIGPDVILDLDSEGKLIGVEFVG